MSENKDTYRTIAKASEEVLFKDRGSKFFAFAFPVTNAQEIQEALDSLKVKHHKAGHHCYAWRIGMESEKQTFRVNDDGEPSNSAGQPIYGQIQSFDLTNILIVSVRYFGGTKLGVGGLIQAYKTNAKQAIEESVIIEKTINKEITVQFEYIHMNKIMRIIKEQQLTIVSQQMTMDCTYNLSIRKNKLKNVIESIKRLRIAEITIVD